jgi:hypothetical protein
MQLHIEESRTDHRWLPGLRASDESGMTTGCDGSITMQ